MKKQDLLKRKVRDLNIGPDTTLTWYLPSFSALFDTPGGEALSVKMILVLAMIVIIYGNNIYNGKKIVRLSKEGKMDEVQKNKEDLSYDVIHIAGTYGGNSFSCNLSGVSPNINFLTPHVFRRFQTLMQKQLLNR